MTPHAPSRVLSAAALSCIVGILPLSAQAFDLPSKEDLPKLDEKVLRDWQKAEKQKAVDACGEAEVEACEDAGGKVELQDGATIVPIDKGLDKLPGKGVTKKGKASQVCACTKVMWIPRQITNAKKGDAILVPLDQGSGDTAVKAVMSAIGQVHRHVLLSVDDGDNVRHATAYTDDLSTDDLQTVTASVWTGWHFETVTVPIPKLQAHLLQNATPGILTQSIDGATGTSRLTENGLVLKPGTENPKVGKRAQFEAAAAAGLGVEGYYKVSDYTNQVGMTLPWAAEDSSDYYDEDLRGTHCAGFVHWSFAQVGLTVPLAHYDATTRDFAAEELHDAVRASVKDALSGLTGLAASVVGAGKLIANQVVNCFAGIGCDDNSAEWKDGVGSGDAVSPDNLLPTSFTLQGSGETLWGDDTLAAGDTQANANGASSTPFQRVEPQIVAGGYYDVVTLYTW